MAMADDGGGISMMNSSPTLTYCNLWGNDPNDYSGGSSPVGSDGNISEDPEFVSFSLDTDWSEWDLHLTSGSALIDAGDPSLLDPDGTVSDIGAYGGPGAADW